MMSKFSPAFLGMVGIVIAGAVLISAGLYFSSADLKKTLDQHERYSKSPQSDDVYSVLKARCSVFRKSPYIDSELGFHIDFTDDQLACLMKDDIQGTREIYLWNEGAFDSQSVDLPFQNSLLGKVSINPPVEMMNLNVIDNFDVVIDGISVKGEIVQSNNCNNIECAQAKRVLLERFDKQISIEEYNSNLKLFQNIQFLKEEPRFMFMDLDVYAFDVPVVDTSSWQTITNNDAGFSFKIPQDWVFKGCGDGFKDYDVESCDLKKSYLTIIPASQLVAESGGDFFQIGISDVRDLDQRASTLSKNLDQEVSDEQSIMKFVGVYRYQVGDTWGLLSVSENTVSHVKIFQFILNKDDFSVSVYGSEGLPYKDTPSGTFKAFLNSVQLQQKNETVISESDTKIYSSEKWHFSIEYPAYSDDIQETNKSVSFRKTNDPGPWYSFPTVFVEPTQYDSIDAWLDAQDVGGINSEGYGLEIRFTASGSSEGIVVSEYVIGDHDYDRPIYYKGLWAVFVKNGFLYRIPLGSSMQFRAENDVVIGDYVLDFARSFRPYTR